MFNKESKYYNRSDSRDINEKCSECKKTKSLSAMYAKTSGKWICNVCMITRDKNKGNPKVKLFDKFIRELGNLRTGNAVSYCSLCKLLKERTIEISIQDRPNFDFLLNVVLCEDCFKEALKVILDE